jgi:ferredoxin
VEALLARLPSTRTEVRFTRPGPADPPAATGRLTVAALAALGVPPDATAYVCGPPAFLRDVPAALAAVGVARDRIRTELFGAAAPITPGILADAPPRPPHPPAGPVGSGAPVTFARSGLTVAWDPGYGTVLDLAEACDVPVRWSCRAGVCHTCETGVLAGEVVHDPVPVDAPAPASALICSARPVGEVVLDL